MNGWRETTPGLSGHWGQERATNPTPLDLEAQYRRAVDAMARWDGTLALDAHPLLQRQRDRDNRELLALHPDLALLVLAAMPHYLDDLDVREAWRVCRHSAPRTLLGFDTPRRWPPMHWPAILVRELVATFVRKAVG